MKKFILLSLISLIFFNCSSDGSDDSGDTNNCPKPNGLSVYSLTNTTAILSWNDNVNSSLYQVEYGPLGFTLGSGTTTSVPNTYANIENLLPQTQYAFYVNVYCNDQGNYSDWAGPYSFVTLDYNPYCDEPTSFNLSLFGDSLGFDFVELDWDNGADGFEIEYGLTGFNLGNGTIQTSSRTVNGLTAETTYDFYVRNDCSNYDYGYSNWVGPLTITTESLPSNPNCIDPTNFISLGTGTNTDGSKYFDFTWTHPNSQNSWEVARIIAGTSFDPTTANIIATSYDSVRLTYGSSTSGQAYDFYLRANCGGSNGYSGWVGPITVTAQ